MAEHLAAHFRTMSRGARQLDLGSWEDTFWEMAERADRDDVTAEELAELVDYDYRAGNDDPKGGAATLFAALIKDASAPSLKEENERLRVALRNLTNNVRGLMAFEGDLRAVAGNTNVNVLQEHLEDARDALGEPEYRCPECGYTQADAAFYMDHHICEARGGPPMPPRAALGETGS